MYTKKYTNEHGYQVTETFHSWYDVLLEGYAVWFFCGLVSAWAFVGTPFMVLYCLLRPNSFGHSFQSVSPDSDLLLPDEERPADNVH